VRLRRDLNLNLAGTALALDLLDELEHLRERLRALEHQLGQTRTRELG
jgi:chaperone modulatory protein CbpM